MTKRERALEMLGHGCEPHVIALALQVRVETVKRWRSGQETRGRPPGLTEGNRSLVPRIRVMRKGGMSYAEIGEAIGVSRGWVRSLLLRGTAEGV
jgi:DNA-binding CsgD family transcriptional regulator